MAEFEEYRNICFDHVWMGKMILSINNAILL